MLRRDFQRRPFRHRRDLLRGARRIRSVRRFEMGGRSALRHGRGARTQSSLGLGRGGVRHRRSARHLVQPFWMRRSWDVSTPPRDVRATRSSSFSWSHRGAAARDDLGTTRPIRFSRARPRNWRTARNIRVKRGTRVAGSRSQGTASRPPQKPKGRTRERLFCRLHHRPEMADDLLQPAGDLA